MRRFIILILIFFVFFTGSDLFGIARGYYGQLYINTGLQDSIKENQVLYNGRLWRNIYYLVQDDQFLFSKEFLPGSLSVRGKTFTNIPLKYDLFADEILTPVDPGGILQLNKEMVDSFSISFQNKTYQFIKLQEDSLKGSQRYFNVLYKGRTGLYLKYTKKIGKLAVEGKYDRFYQLIRICFVKDNIVYTIRRKSDLLKVLIEDKALIKSFIKKNKLDITEKNPESFIPVIRYYDSLNQ
jgi:hypothetical protein